MDKMEVDHEECQSLLRFEWLHTLKKDELQLLCLNRQLKANAKEDLIDLLLKSKLNSDENFDSKTKPTLLLELKSRGHEMEDTTPTPQLVELMNKYKSKKLTKQTLNKLNNSELTKLCNRRKIKVKDTNSKEILINLLKESNVPDPEYTDSMTSKQLSAEMRGRGLTTTGLKKQDMLESLQDEETHEEQILMGHLTSDKVDKVIDDVENALTDYLKYIKSNKDQIQELTKKEVIENGGKKDRTQGTDWGVMRNVVSSYKQDMFDLRTMIEVYGGTDMGKDEETYKNKFDCIIDYENESEFDEEDEDEIVYVVYDGDENLILAQSKRALLGVFEDEEDAEDFKNQLQDEDEDDDLEISIQEVRLNDFKGALPDSDDSDDDTDDDDDEDSD